MMPVKKPAHLKVLTWDEIEAADDLITEMVDVPEWGGAVKIRALSRKRCVETLDECVGEETGVRDNEKLQMLLVTRGVVEPQLSDDRAEQLNKKHVDPIARVSQRVQIISGMDTGAQ
jgi:hypothetical protein